MNKSYEPLLIILIVCFTSCVFDPPRSHIEIENSSSDTLIFVVKYNRSFILNEYRSDTCISTIIKNSTYNPNNCISLQNFDSIELTGKYTVDPNCTFYSLLSMSQVQKFEFDSIKVLTPHETIKIAGTIDNLKLFTKHRWNTYKLKIK
jgi:hypothetical protein